MFLTTFRVFGLTRETVPDAWFDDHTEPKPYATSHGLRPTRIRFVTFIVVASIRRMAFW